ncbi:hypothetical protein cypCar_00029894 [Cyprinus carpio]|nr:hypothetical protein cypCar_00029894 [Cyprinus carpio]
MLLFSFTANDIGLQMEEGMSFTIGLKLNHPTILMEGSSEFKILRDKWTAVSVDDKRCMLCSVSSPTLLSPPF